MTAELSAYQQMIQDLVNDHTETHAFAWYDHKNHSYGHYGHIYVDIFPKRAKPVWKYDYPFIRVSCQLGSGDENRRDAYAFHYGAMPRYGKESMSVDDMELMLKPMRAIKKFLDNNGHSFPDAQSFAEYAMRILEAVKCKRMIAFEDEYWMRDRFDPKDNRKLLSDSVHMRDHLNGMEKTLKTIMFGAE